jgi:hypothetical protein
MNVQEVYKELQSCPYGAKSVILDRYAAIWGVSKATVYRAIEKEFGKRRNRTKREFIIKDEYIDAIARLKALSMSYGQKSRELTTEDAIEIAENRGIIPAGLLKVSTVNARLRDKGFRKQKPSQRYLEEFCNQAHYIDFSRSEYISIADYDKTSGEYILKTSPKSLRYKNKQGKSFGLWLAGLRDGKSGIRLVKYYTVTGENSYMGMDFLQWCWHRAEDDHPLNYFPYYLRIDNGPLQKNKDVQAMLEALEIETKPCEAYNKDSMGKIERTWRTFWQRFELKLVMEVGMGQCLSVNDLNQLAFKYCVKEAHKAHAIFRDTKKIVMYERDLLAYPPRVYEGEIANLASRPLRRKVGNDLMYWIDNEPYQAPERYQNRWILIHKNMKGDLVGEGEHDGRMFDIEPFEFNAFNQYSRFPDTYRETMLKEAIGDQQALGKVVKIKPKPEAIKPDSPHGRGETLLDAGVFTPDAAKLYIVRQLHLDSYTEVAIFFDPLLVERTDKAAIDEIINILDRRAV